MITRSAILVLVAFGSACGGAPQVPPAEPGTFVLRTRQLEKTGTLRWKASETAVLICDMWDRHTCANATRRVGEMAPRVDAFVAAARKQGAFIVHCPSDTMKFYEGTPQRERAKSAPAAKPPVEIKARRLIPEKEGKLPIDDSDWCDDEPKCPIKETVARGWPWTRQIETIAIAPEDAVSESGTEIYNLCEQKGLRNVVLVGVHTNMCVLGRSFGIRQMTMLGRNVLLARDLTDCLYDPKKEPRVSHDRGTELVVEHIERHWCPTFLSADIAGR